MNLSEMKTRVCRLLVEASESNSSETVNNCIREAIGISQVVVQAEESPREEVRSKASAKVITMEELLREKL